MAPGFSGGKGSLGCVTLAKMKNKIYGLLEGLESGELAEGHRAIWPHRDT